MGGQGGQGGQGEHTHDADAADPVREPLDREEFEKLWGERDFKEIVRESATGHEALRYRRIVMEGRVAAAQYEMVRWTKRAVLAAIGTAIVSLLVTVTLALSGADRCV
jgi:hypothetical protein